MNNKVVIPFRNEFILKNSNFEKISKEKETVLEFLYMCNDLDVTFTTYLAAKDKI